MHDRLLSVLLVLLALGLMEVVHCKDSAEASPGWRTTMPSEARATQHPIIK
jgi:hypothetical protein